MKCLLALVFSAGFTAYSQGRIGNIVPNGDFEDIANHTFAPWHGHAFVVNEPERAASGGNFAIPLDAPDPLYQDLLTTPRTVYELRFAFGGYDAGQVNGRPLIVRWGDKEVVSFPIRSLPQPQWNYYSYTVEAAESKTRLSFSSSSFAWIDDVSVVAVPEPSTLTLFLVGFVSVMRRSSLFVA